MELLYFQSLVQYSIDPETGDVKVLKKFTVPIKGTQNKKNKAIAKQRLTTEVSEEIVEL